MKFGEWIKQQRQGKGLTREQLAKAAQISTSTMGQIERGSIKRPPMKRLVAFSKTLNIKLSVIKQKVISLSIVAGLSALFYVNSSNFLHVVSYSGGKDSTAMIDLMALSGMPIDLVMFCDLGKELPQLYAHNKELEEKTGLKITTVKPPHPWEYYFSEKPVYHNGKIHHYGYGWCGHGRVRWGTTLKRETIQRYLKELRKSYSIIEYHGIAVDEPDRLNKNNDGRAIEYPLADWGMTRKKNLDYCYSQGYSWGGLYNNLVRVSCYCCQNKRLSELEYIYNEYPNQWKDIEALQKATERNPHLKKFAFRKDYTIEGLKTKFRNNQLFSEHSYFKKNLFLSHRGLAMLD